MSPPYTATQTHLKRRTIKISKKHIFWPPERNSFDDQGLLSQRNRPQTNKLSTATKGLTKNLSAINL